MEPAMTDPIFKIVPRAEWAEITDAYEGSAHDQADGFLHFSTHRNCRKPCGAIMRARTI